MTRLLVLLLATFVHAWAPETPQPNARSTIAAEGVARRGLLASSARVSSVSELRAALADALVSTIVIANHLSLSWDGVEGAELLLSGRTMTLTGDCAQAPPVPLLGPPGTCIIDASLSRSRVFAVRGGAVTLRQLQFLSGLSNSAGEGGGCVACTESCQLTVMQSGFQNCTAPAGVLAPTELLPSEVTSEDAPSSTP